MENTLQKNYDSDFDVIRYKSLSDITVEKLRHAIIVGELSPGARITETAISEKMGVSRVVVREAILVLIGEGMLVKERNKYTKVYEFKSPNAECCYS